MAANTSRSVMQKESSMKSYRDTSYREKPATPNSPSGTTVTTMYDHMLSPSSPADIEEKEGRLPNHFLDEVVSDIRSDDSMDLDFDDFCHNEQQQAMQRSLGGQQRYPSGEQRRPSVTASSSYSTSDSLCAMAKLTHSIANENSMADGEGKRSSPECASIKQEPCYGDGDTTSGVNDTDQGKAAAAGKLALQKQMNEGNNSLDLKRKREMAGQETNTDQSNGMAAHSQQMAPPAQRRQSYLDYSYQDDFAMADMTEPDTMINYSELPQQPNYYQCPQSAEDSLNLGFNMSLHANQTSIPTAHQHPPSNMARYPFGVPQSNDVSMGRSSPHTRMAQSAMIGQAGSMPVHQGGFHPYQAQENAAMPSSVHQVGAIQRSESFPGATVNHNPANQFPSAASAPVQEPAKSEPAHQPSSASAAHRTGPPLTSSAGSRTPSMNGSNTQQDFLQQLISDSSSAFRSHPLFPLLRDLIIADINFFEKSFPHKLIVNLPSDFDKLLRNYLSRNPPKKDYQCIQSVESVLMDALKYAHHILIEKINQWKVQERQKMPSSQSMQSAEASALSAPMSRLQSVGEYCDGSSIKHDMSQGYVRSQMNVGKPTAAPPFRPPRRESGPAYGDMGPPTPGSTYSQPLSVDTGSVESPTSVRQTAPLTSQPTNMYSSGQPPYPQHPLSGNYSRSPNPRNPYMPPHGGPPCPPPNYTVSPNNPPPSRHQQPMYEMPPPSGMYADPNSYHDPYNSCMPPPSAHHRLNHLGANERHLMYMNNINDPSLVKAVMDGKEMFESMSDTASVISGHSIQGSVKGQQQGQGKPTEGRKHASLPKEAVNIMLNWLREHQDKPYPNDDEKGMLIKQTGLSITQINYWFTNARRRLLPKWRGEDM